MSEHMETHLEASARQLMSLLIADGFCGTTLEDMATHVRALRASRDALRSDLQALVQQWEARAEAESENFTTLDDCAGQLAMLLTRHGGDQ